MTGAPMPAGVDAVVPAEYATRDGGTHRDHAAVAPGQHVGHVGEDIGKGAAALRAGRRLRRRTSA